MLSALPVIGVLLIVTVNRAYDLGGMSAVAIEVALLLTGAVIVAIPARKSSS